MIVNALIIVGVLIIVLLIVGASYEFIATQSEKRKFKSPPGKMIDIGDYALHMNIMGERQANQPVVILEASVGANSLDWQLVQPLIAKFAQVVAYDRAGSGWSEKAQTPRTPDNLVDDLHQFLHAAEIEPPYLLVGHRYGGMYVRKYLEKYPDEVAGLVLVDSTHPSVFNEDNTPEITRLRRQRRYFQPFGLVRYVTQRNIRVKLLPEAQQAEYVAKMMHDNPNMLAEVSPILINGCELPDSVDVPLTVVSRGEDPDLKLERQWAELQRDLATLSDKAKHVSTKSTKNWIIFDEPQTIADAIQDMLEDMQP